MHVPHKRTGTENIVQVTKTFLMLWTVIFYGKLSQQIYSVYSENRHFCPNRRALSASSKPHGTPARCFRQAWEPAHGRCSGTLPPALSSHDKDQGWIEPSGNLPGSWKSCCQEEHAQQCACRCDAIREPDCQLSTSSSVAQVCCHTFIRRLWVWFRHEASESVLHYKTFWNLTPWVVLVN